jgi:Reverse transcriptase (RNA-dependent DNA polymerase)
MKESYGKDPASHPDPESCIGDRKGAGEALTGANVGQPSSCEIRSSGVPTRLSDAEGNTEGGVIGEPPSDPAQSETLCTRGNSSHGKREIPRVPAGGAAGRSEKVYDRTSGMHAPGKSDDRVVPGKPPNKGVPEASAEVVEGRRSAEGNTMQAAATRTQSRLDALIALNRVREAARRDRRARFTAKVNWVLDADIRGFFDNIDHGWLLKFLEHRIADRRILRLIQRWLTAGVSEEGQWTKTEVGTPQGAVASPLLANVFLHYVFDLWVQQWRTKFATGDVIVVRYADDFVVGFQHRREAERFLRELGERFEKFGLALHPEKTRLIEFGRFAAENRRKRGDGKPETFTFLGFTHI